MPRRAPPLSIEEAMGPLVADAPWRRWRWSTVRRSRTHRDFARFPGPRLLDPTA